MITDPSADWGELKGKLAPAAPYDLLFVNFIIGTSFEIYLDGYANRELSGEVNLTGLNWTQQVYDDQHARAPVR